jgi:hypothetical protein
VGLSSRYHERLEWQADNQFRVSWIVVGDTQTTAYSIEGKVSTDTRTVESITATTEFEDTDYEGKVWTRTEKLTLTNMPINKLNCGDTVRRYVSISGDEARQYATHYEDESRIVGDYGEKGDRLDRFVGFDWDYPEQEPRIEIEFSAIE